MITQRSVVKWFDAKKGYGFIVNPQGGRDIFVHYSQIVTDKRFRTLRTGQVIEYQLTDGPKGPHAQNILLVEDVPDAYEPLGVRDVASLPPLSSEPPRQPLYSHL